ncbi:MAG: translocation protein TolB [bacterium ADurb.Bin478]|nr:MAG: translocation protein TolB [bacterium ADurb.Bin478]
MIRESQRASAAMVACTVHGDGLTCLQYRKAGDEDVQEIRFSVTGPDVVQLEKKGNLFTMSAARFGDRYEAQNLENVNLPDNLLAGLFICSHNDTISEEVEFTNVRIFNTAPDTLVQYRDYLGSLLEILEVESGKRHVLAGSDHSWQAPNWTPDGSALIYNAEGLLYQSDIRTGVSSLLNTGFADRNNNDHVLSFDGRLIGISHHAKESGGESVVYTLPAAGGTPTRVTAKSPSYLHGWSPDSRFLVYTGERDGEFDIYKIPAEGGREIRLTTSRGLDDGSEYAPDGRSIFFCSSRTGKMQIWRMDPDGKNQQQLTFDDLNNWFPHVSPDNKWIAFLSFPQEVPADQHPFYQRVYLRLMPATGGEPRVIAYLYGGQGSINVPSWSPDSRRIGFVSNGQFR